MEKKTQIVMIDDDLEVCNLVKQALERTGRYEVIFSTHPLEGIELVKSRMPSLILLDQVMPEMNGTHVAQALSEDETTKNIDIVFLSSVAASLAFMVSMSENDEFYDKPDKGAGQYFIQKPISPRELVERLDLILSGKK